MPRTGKILPVLIFITALMVCLTIFFVVYKPVQLSGPVDLHVYKTPPAPTPANSPAEDEPVHNDVYRTPPPTPANSPAGTEKVNLSDIDTVHLSTSYRGFYAADSNCRTAVDPGVEGGNDTSLCETNLTFNRDGSVIKSIERHSLYQAGKPFPPKTGWKANISPEQYNSLLKSLSDGESFISWPTIQIYTSNFAVTVEHNGKVTQWISNLSEKNAGQIPMIETFRQLDSHLNWE